MTTNPENREVQQNPAQPITDVPSGNTGANRASIAEKIFISADGLRAGWSLLIFFAITAVLVTVINLLARKLLASAPQQAPGAPLSLQFGIIAELIPFLAILFVTWIMSKIEQRPIAAFGLGGSDKMKHFFAGLGWGAVCLSVLVLTLWKAGLLILDGRLLFGFDIVRRGLAWLFGFLLVGLFEEYLSRGYLQYTLTRGLSGLYAWLFKTGHAKSMGFWTSALVFSILFGLGHKSNPGESPIGLLSAGSVGMVFCLSLWRTGSLWWAIGFHTSWDWAQSFLYGVADSGLMIQHHVFATHPVGAPLLSGGVTGPEGSIFVLAVLALVVLIILFTLPRADRSYGSAS